ncbi:MAG: hypothetical protein E7052_08945 [Lentisphaerae bacterium]|nr:hypothetical protein [Lentisphaerota bacterium]
MVELNEIKFGGFEKALEMTNGIVRLVISVEAGPRVLFYGFTGGQNFFHIFENEAAPLDDGVWHSYGGHRLWYAPEDINRTYYPDNKPVAWSFENNTLLLDCPDESSRQLGKRIAITLKDDSTLVKVDHTLKNIGLWPLEVSVWCLSVMAEGGTLKVPQSDYVPHGGGPGETFLPSRKLVLWPFTDMGDVRFKWGSKFIEMRQDNSVPGKLKFGALNEHGYALYELNGETFRKDYPYIADANYPDMGCNSEFYTQDGFLEIESLSPMVRLAEGAEVTHTEYWSLSR